MIQSNSTHPSDSSPPSNSLDKASSHHQDQVNSAVQFVLGHLEKESEYLDTVIQCSLRMKNLLQRRSTPRPKDKWVAKEETKGNRKARTRDDLIPLVTGDFFFNKDTMTFYQEMPETTAVQAETDRTNPSTFAGH